MKNPAIPMKATHSSNNPLNNLQKPELYQAGYQQALEDFAILPLLHKLRPCSGDKSDSAWVSLTNQEAEAIAVVLIQSLTAKLNSKLLATCLKNLCLSSDLSQTVASLQLAPLTTNLPASFPNVAMPRFLYGDRLCWNAQSAATDWGIVIGRFYSFAPHTYGWQWCYLILLDATSPSATWTRADIAWEEDLQAMNLAPVNGITEH